MKKKMEKREKHISAFDLLHTPGEMRLEMFIGIFWCIGASIEISNKTANISELSLNLNLWRARHLPQSCRIRRNEYKVCYEWVVPLRGQNIPHAAEISAPSKRCNDVLNVTICFFILRLGVNIKEHFQCVCCYAYACRLLVCGDKNVNGM